MKKHVILAFLAVCVVPMSTFARRNPPSIDRLQEMLFGVSTLKGVEEVYPQVQIEVIKQNVAELSSISQIETLSRNDVQEQVVQALQKAGIKISGNSDMSSEKAPLSLNITVFIKVTGDASPVYNTFIYTEAVQQIRLARDNSIRSQSRTWPMAQMGLQTRNMFVLDSKTLEKTVKDEVVRQVGVFVTDFLAANPKPVALSAAGVDIAALRKTLLEENTQARYGLSVGANDPSLQAIQKLESAGSQEAVNVLLEFLTNNRMDRKLKQNALTALGRIGTEPAIEAIKKFETWSRKRYAEPLPFYMGQQEFAIDHFESSDVKPLAQTADSKNKTWAVVLLGNYGQSDVFLTSLIKDEQWSEPVLLTLAGLPERQDLSKIKWNLKVDGDSVRIESDNKIYDIKISDQLKDADKDGLPDIVEARLSTNPNTPDTDGDGIPDGRDSNPLTPKHKETNDTTEIRQAVFSVLFATTSSRNFINIVDRDEFAKQEYYGYSGAVLRVPNSKEGLVNVTSIDIRYQSNDSATVSIRDYEGSLAASSHEAKLKKINGKWVVVDFSLRGIA